MVSESSGFKEKRLSGLFMSESLFKISCFPLAHRHTTRLHSGVPAKATIFSLSWVNASELNWQRELASLKTRFLRFRRVCRVGWRVEW